MNENQIPPTSAPATSEPLPPEPPRKRTGIRPAVWVGLLLVAGFLVFGLSAFQKSLTPYVSFADARETSRTVQVAGAPIKESADYDETARELRFDIADEKGDKLSVVYAGVRPANFDDAVSVVAIGRWDGNAVRAEKLLVKCPSKYQGEEVKSYSTAS